MECFKQGRNLIRLMFCKVGFGWWVENGPSRERVEAARPARYEMCLLHGGQAGILCAHEVSQATSPPFSPCSYPKRLGLSYRALVKATVICLLETLFGTCGKGPTDTVQSVSFFSPGYSESHIWKIRNLKVYLIWWLCPLPVL